jgi:hypothetical protein
MADTLSVEEVQTGIVSPEVTQIVTDDALNPAKTYMRIDGVAPVVSEATVAQPAT